MSCILYIMRVRNIQHTGENEMTYDEMVKIVRWGNDYGMIGRIGSIEDDVDGDTYYTVYFDDGAVKRFTADNLETV